VSTSTLKKSAAAMAPQCALRNVFRGIFLPRSGAGSTPCSLRIRWIVDRPRSKPRFLIAPRSRVYPHVGFSRAIARSCFTFSPRTVCGRATLRERLPPYFAATLSRYHRRIVSGVASDATSASRLRPSGFPV